MPGLSPGECLFVVNRYIGVDGGYLIGFSYRTHQEFYPEYCDLDIDPLVRDGTTRERFLTILREASPTDQAKIIKGVLKKFPAGSLQHRTEDLANKMLVLAAGLEAGSPIAAPRPEDASAVVQAALRDAEILLERSGAASAIDRVHTALHGYLRLKCESNGLAIERDASAARLLTLLLQTNSRLAELDHSEEAKKVLRSLVSLVDGFGTVRNRGSLAHANESLVAEPEALLLINAARAVLHYLEARF